MNREDDAYRRGHEAGYSDGYAAGRVAGREDARAERLRAPLPEDKKSNGWVAVTPELAEQFGLTEDFVRVYVIRDMMGNIIDIIDSEIATSSGEAKP